MEPLSRYGLYYNKLNNIMNGKKKETDYKPKNKKTTTV